MDSILVVNAGSSSVKFELFAVDGSVKLTRKIKGQIDGIGTRPRLRARGADSTSLVDREYDAATYPSYRRRCTRPVHGCGKSSAHRQARSATVSCMAAPSTTAQFG